MSVLTKCILASVFAVAAHAASPAPKPSAAAPASSAATAAKPGTLDQKAIHEAYNEGDFEKVTNLIEAYNKANKSYSRADSVFIAKHLAVVYSANPQTREKGRYYMYRLLEMMPSAELVDMFVSDEIDRIFEKVRKEFLTRQKGFGVDSTQISTPEKPATGSAAAASTATASAKPAQQGPSKEFLEADQKGNQSYWKRNAFWIAGGVGLVVAGTAAYFIYASGDDQPTTHTITIPNNSQASK